MKIKKTLRGGTKGTTNLIKCKDGRHIFTREKLCRYSCRKEEKLFPRAVKVKRETVGTDPSVCAASPYETGGPGLTPFSTLPVNVCVWRSECRDANREEGRVPNDVPVTSNKKTGDLTSGVLRDRDRDSGTPHGHLLVYRRLNYGRETSVLVN